MGGSRSIVLQAGRKGFAWFARAELVRADQCDVLRGDLPVPASLALQSSR